MVKADKEYMLALLEENRKARKVIQDIQYEITKNESAIKKELAKELGINYLDIEITYAWRCDDPEEKKWMSEAYKDEFPNGWEPKAVSPIGYCVYNDEEDPCCDSCLYCGMPDERK